MNRMSRRLLALALPLAVTLVACGGGDDDSASDTTTAAVETKPDATAPPPTTTQPEAPRRRRNRRRARRSRFRWPAPPVEQALLFAEIDRVLQRERRP